MTLVNDSIEPGSGVATVTLNRPERLNALGFELMDQLLEALGRLARDSSCKALIVTGSGSAFCAGADLAAFAEVRAQNRYMDAGEQVSEAMRERFNPLVAALFGFPKPVVTAINGMAAGGGAAIALAADVVLCGTSGRLKFVQAQQLNIVADLGAHWLLQRAGGRVAALGATLLGETLDAERCARLGLVWEVVPDRELLAKAQATADKLGRVPADVVAATRSLVDSSLVQGFGAMLEAERLCQREFCARPACVDKIEAFLGGRSTTR